MKKQKLLSIENIDFILFGALMISFFLHYRINGFIAMLLIIWGAGKLVAKKQSYKGFSGLLFLPLIFILLVIGQLYTEDLKQGWTLVERNLSFLLLPIALGTIIGMSKKKQNALINIFIGAVLVAGLYCIGYATYAYLQTGSIYTHPTDTHFLYNTFMHHRLTDPLGLHAVYYSLFIAFSSSILFNRFFDTSISKNKKGIYMLVFLFFMVLLFLLKSANITFGFALVCILAIGMRFGKIIFQSKKGILLAIIGTVFIGLLTYKVMQTKLENFSVSYEMSNEQLTPIGIRLSIWECSWEVIKDNWFLGTGTGDSQEELMKIYKANNFTIGIENDFNTHNMYLQYWMSNGIIMLSVFLGGIFLLFKKAIHHKNIIFLSFLVLFVLFSITESTLRTQKGMLFFVFISSLFYWSPTLWMSKTSEK